MANRDELTAPPMAGLQPARSCPRLPAVGSAAPSLAPGAGFQPASRRASAVGFRRAPRRSARTFPSLSLADFPALHRAIPPTNDAAFRVSWNSSLKRGNGWKPSRKARLEAGSQSGILSASSSPPDESGGNCGPAKARPRSQSVTVPSHSSAQLTSIDYSRISNSGH